MNPFISEFNKRRKAYLRLRPKSESQNIVHTKEESSEYFELPEQKNSPNENWEIDNKENQIKL